MLSGLLMVFILFLTLMVYSFQTAHEEKQRTLTNIETELKQARAALGAKQAQINRLLGIRSDIIEALRQEFMDEAIGVEVDPQTGAIRFQGGVFFEVDKTEISDSGREHLQQFIPKYMSIILSPAFRPHIAQIIVEGHTDKTGSYLYNLDLSQRRAYAVVRYVLSPEFPDFPEKHLLQTVLTANGRSWSQPLKVDGVIDWDRSRRVEFQFRLRDDELIQQIRELLENR
ncbi:MAG: OmpA family protein [Firmicutes bacterium]|jgi:outer membrane protein OmpA-like peptidoglycan-associated protein|nr:OmpA family protein [Bacillota bacterium]